MAKMTVERFAEAVAAGLGGRLVALLLYGSAARGTHVPDRSDVNTLLICDTVDEDLFAALEQPVRDWVKAGHVAPLILTQQEWQSSADAFPIEYEDMRGAHRVLAGRDPWAGITVQRDQVRRQLEHELVGKLVRLRQAYAAQRGVLHDAAGRAAPCREVAVRRPGGAGAGGGGGDGVAGRESRAARDTCSGRTQAPPCSGRPVARGLSRRGGAHRRVRQPPYLGGITRERAPALGAVGSRTGWRVWIQHDSDLRRAGERGSGADQGAAAAPGGPDSQSRRDGEGICEARADGLYGSVGGAGQTCGRGAIRRSAADGCGQRGAHSAPGAPARD